jgi:2-polyprenyl-3-methyl-5-hydroxy-6-metoxy-1,4-benzoquinol methylase
MVHTVQKLDTDSIAHGGAQAYSVKAASYFTGIRPDYLNELPINRDARILEVGCGDGANGALALSEGRCGTYCGVELCAQAAQLACTRITEVVTGDVEHLVLTWPKSYFDVLILSEVLEHLVDPWATLRKLKPLLRAEALVFASSPNVSHHRVVSMVARGDWKLADLGVMDRTHLRWFTPATYRALFESCAYAVESVRELEPLSFKAEIFSLLTFNRFRHLFIRQISLRARSV